MPIFWFCWWGLLWQNLPGAAYAELGHILSLARLGAGVAASKNPMGQNVWYFHTTGQIRDVRAIFQPRKWI